MNRIREIIRLQQVTGLSNRSISEATGVSRPVVAHYLGLFRQSGLDAKDIEALNDSELEARLRPSEPHLDPRYDEFAPLAPELLKELGKKGVTRYLLWEEYRREHRQGYSYSQFCFHLQAYGQTSDLSMHLDHVAGEQLFIDFAGTKPEILDPMTGVLRPVELFVAVFPASALVYVEATESQQVEPYTMATRHTLEYAGGSPLIVTPDNLRSGVKTPDRYEPEIAQSFADMAAHYGMAVVPARPRHPRDKALVELTVNLVYQRILAPLRHRSFPSLDALNQAFSEKLEALNDQPMQRLGISRRERFTQIEAPVLRPLPATGYRLRRFRQATVQYNYHAYVSEDKHFYSVPWTYARKKVQVVYDELTVEISYRHERIASHRRDRKANGYSTHVEHMPPHHRYVAEWSPQRFKEWAAKVGPDTERLVAVVLEKGLVAEQGYRSCMGILKLTDHYPPQRLEAACRRALVYGVSSYRGIRTILEKGLDRVPAPAVDAAPPAEHENIRGGEYYGSSPTGGTR